MINGLAITTTLVIGVPAFFPVLSSAIVCAGCGVTKLVFTKSALPLIACLLPAISDPIGVESIISEIPNTLPPLNKMGFHLVKMED